MTTSTLVITADDYGLAPEVDAGIVDLIRKGRVSAVSVLVNPPFRPDRAQLASHPIALGLHLNLTLGLPCCCCDRVPSLIGRAGTFHPEVVTQLASLVPAEVALEWAAQLQAFRTWAGCAPTHLNVHKHLHAHDERLFALALELAHPLGIPVRTLREDMRIRCRAAGVLTTDTFLGDVTPTPYWTIERLLHDLERLPPGLTELMCHPGRGVGCLPGLWYAQQRNTERETFLDPVVGELLCWISLQKFHPGLW